MFSEALLVSEKNTSKPKCAEKITPAFVVKYYFYSKQKKRRSERGTVAWWMMAHSNQHRYTLHIKQS